VHLAELQRSGIDNDDEVALIGWMKVHPIFVFEEDLHGHVANVIELRSRAVQNDFHADAGVFKLVFEAIARDLHLLQAQHGFVVEPVVLRFDLAAVFDPVFVAAG
jgi:hypothetical protein